MTTERPQEPEEQPTPDTDVEREEPPIKSEPGMTPGKDWPSAPPERELEYDPATRRTPQGGGPD
ncbi:MAG: hypothetical protein WED87_01020 [Dehalococcoidia bacterium]